jgi:hypothetical protein
MTISNKSIVIDITIRNKSIVIGMAIRNKYIVIGMAISNKSPQPPDLTMKLFQKSCSEILPAQITVYNQLNV